MSILYVDDDAEDIEIFYEAVKAVDPSILCLSATSGSEAFKLLYQSERLPDHLFLDINMPGMDGNDCLSELRKESRFNNINVIVYSTNTFPRDMEQIHSLGATFVRKANTFRDLCVMIRDLRR